MMNLLKRSVLFLLIVAMFSNLSFSLNSNTTYSCLNSTTLFQNKTYSDGSYEYAYTNCADGCQEGYCVDSSPILKVGLMGVISLIAVSLFFYKAIEFFDIPALRMLFFTLSMIMSISAVIESGVVGLNWLSTQSNSEILIGVGTALIWIFIFVMAYLLIKLLKNAYDNSKRR